MSEFAERLKRCREMLGISQTKLAQLCELDASSINHFESGRREPSLGNLRKLKKALNVPYEMLISNDEEKKNT